MQKAVAEAPAPVAAAATPVASAAATAMPVLVALSFCHMLNDMMQSLIPSLYPLLKDEFDLNYTQIGLIALAFQLVL